MVTVMSNTGGEISDPSAMHPAKKESTGSESPYWPIPIASICS
jgi:hypothetical protein